MLASRPSHPTGFGHHSSTDLEPDPLDLPLPIYNAPEHEEVDPNSGVGLWMSLAETLEPTDAESLQAHFNSSDFFNESSYCRHDFKLVSSKIFSSSKIQQAQREQAQEVASALSSRGTLSAHSGDANTPTRQPLSHPKSRTESAVSSESDTPWGWFEDVEPAAHHSTSSLGKENDGIPIVKETPTYILTESLSSQKLWYQTAGRRPPQPSREREMYEKMWEQNFSESEVDYSQPLPDQGSVVKLKGNSKKVLYRASSPFGSAVSKSFKCENCGETSSIMVHVPKFQIVQTGSDVHAEYLIVVGLGSVTLGVWRRFSQFKRLATKISGSEKKRQFHNALLSWQCLRNRQRWFRCLDRDYLILKCFLLERFLHDLVFESMSPDTVREFLGVL
ncbi:unnamed protein product [Chrysoparadoxa australica]